MKESVGGAAELKVVLVSCSVFNYKINGVDRQWRCGPGGCFLFSGSNVCTQTYYCVLRTQHELVFMTFSYIYIIQHKIWKSWITFE